MPTYELMLLLRKMPVSELKEILKRTALSVFDIGAVVRNIENLGFRKTPYKIKHCTEANYFLIRFDCTDSRTYDLNACLKRDLDLVRHRIYLIEDKFNFTTKDEKPECDIHFDLLEVPLRPHVQKMVEISKKKERKPFNYGKWGFDPLKK